MSSTEHQIYQILMGIESRLAALDKHTATGLAGLDASLKLHQQETRHLRHGILMRLDKVEKTMENWQVSKPASSFFPGAIAVLTSPIIMRALLAAGMVMAGYSIGEIGDMLAKVP